MSEMECQANLKKCFLPLIFPSFKEAEIVSELTKNVWAIFGRGAFAKRFARNCAINFHGNNIYNKDALHFRNLTKMDKKISHSPFEES